jgi:hypothetical protein
MAAEAWLDQVSWSVASQKRADGADIDSEAVGVPTDQRAKAWIRRDRHLPGPVHASQVRGRRKRCYTTASQLTADT